MSEVKNPLLAEIRYIRLEIDAECQHDPQLFYEYICKLEEKYKDRLVQRAPKPVIKPADTTEIIQTK